MKTIVSITIRRITLATLSLMILIIASHAAAAQQTNTFPASGNVGVGTTTPDTYANVHVYNLPNAGTDIQSVNTGSWSRLRLITGTHSWGWFTGDSSQPDAPNKIGLYDYTLSTFRMMIDSAGNVGIGTAAPSDRLEVNGAKSAISLDTGQLVIRDSSASVATNMGGQIAFGFKYNGTSYANSAEITGGKENSTSGNYAGYLAFSTAANGASNAERMRIDSSGNVGIGMTAPVYSLDVNGGGNAFRAKASTTNSNDAIATFENGSGISAIIRANGNVGIGTTNPTNKLHVAGSITVDGNINAKYQDVAEWVPSSEQLSAGTVVVLDPRKSNQVIASSEVYDTRVAGVISEQPGIALGERGEGKVLVATTGRVRVKVDASKSPIHIGDLLVTSDVSGLAMKSEPVSLGGVQIHRPGTIIGKALEPLAKGSGEILVLLSLQ